MHIRQMCQNKKKQSNRFCSLEYRRSLIYKTNQECFHVRFAFLGNQLQKFNFYHCNTYFLGSQPTTTQSPKEEKLKKGVMFYCDTISGINRLFQWQYECDTVLHKVHSISNPKG